MSKIGQIDIEKLIDYIGEGKTYREMAVLFDVKLATLSDFTSKPEHSARVKEALKLSAETYADKAEQVLIDAVGTKEELMRARELSQFYKWKASKRSPAVYGDKIDMTSGGEKLNQVQIFQLPSNNRDDS